jgi:hypothetical protein
MNRAEALEVAKINHAAHRKADIDHMFGRGPAFDAAEYGYLHGWYMVGDFSFCQDEITGRAYDHTQGGWAYL